MLWKVIGVDEARVEPLQLIRYEPGQCLWQHIWQFLGVPAVPDTYCTSGSDFLG